MPSGSMAAVVTDRTCSDVGRDWDSDTSLQWEEFFGFDKEIRIKDVVFTRATNEVPCFKGLDAIAKRGSLLGHTASYPSTVKNVAAKGTSVDISSSLLNMYDLIAASSKSEKNEETRKIPRINILEVDDGHKKRPLSSSSVSSSSSSSSSLPRSGPESKKLSYLASIESLDDELSEDGTRNMTENLSSDNIQNLSQTDRVLLEIVDSERMYVRDLRVIIEGYLKHISEQEGKLSKQSLKDLFNNIEDIYKFNSSFLEELEMCGLDPVAIARCFVKNSFGFAVYTQYCTNYPRTVSVLTELMRNTETAEIFKERQNALHHVLPLGSYLLKPVQRILKYHLLLENIVKHSDKDNEGYPDIKNALSVMTGIAFHINDMKKRHENAIRVQEIQSLLYGWEGEDLTTYGELVGEGAFRMFRAKALRNLFLFDKMLLISKKREDGILCYKTHIMCSNLMLIESIQGEPLCFHVIPFDNPRYQYTFQARNVEQKREWCLQLKRVILENYNVVIPLHARQLVMELGQGRQNDDSQMEKTSSKKQLSAPEYLEKRKQERRKSESSLKAFRIKKNVKKNEISSIPKTSPRESRNQRMRSISQDNSSDSRLGSGRWRRASVDVLPTTRTFPPDGQKHALVQSTRQSTKSEKYLGLSFMPSKSSKHRQLKPCSFGDIPGRIRDEGTETPTTSAKREKQPKPMWKFLKNFAEETTDTENEDYLDRRCNRFQTDDMTGQSDDESEDFSGEYVTFYLANSHAWRNERPSRDRDRVQNNNELSEDDRIEKTECRSNANQKSYNDKSGSNISELDKLANYDNLIDLWTRLGTIDLQDYSSQKLSVDLTENGTIRRTQSFTETVPIKSPLLHHSTSFRQSGYQENLHIPLHIVEPSHSKTKYQGSKFKKDDDGKSKNTKSSWLSLNFNKSNAKSHGNDQPRVYNSFVTADSKPQPMQMDFVNDLEKYMENSVKNNQNLFNFPVNDHDTATSCYTTPAMSMENIHHPDHRIYKEPKCNSFKELSSKSNVPLQSAEGDDDEYCMLSYDYSIEPITRPESNCSIPTSTKSENEQSKTSSNKLVNSLVKAYANVKQKKREKNRSLSPNLLWNYQVPLSYSNTVGARIAQPCETEYCIPQSLLSNDNKHDYEELLPEKKEEKSLKSELRPDSVLSESSNTTSSSDGEKQKVFTQTRSFTTSRNDKNVNLEHDDTPSDMSDASGDSYYERTFEAFDNGLNEDIFRDSAIYSDPDDADIGIFDLDQNKTTMSSVNSEIPLAYYHNYQCNFHTNKNNINSFSSEKSKLSEIYDIPVKRKVPLKSLYICENDLSDEIISSKMKDVSETFTSIEIFCNEEINSLAKSKLQEELQKNNNVTNIESVEDVTNKEQVTENEREIVEVTAVAECKKMDKVTNDESNYLELTNEHLSKHVESNTEKPSDRQNSYEIKLFSSIKELATENLDEMITSYDNLSVDELKKTEPSIKTSSATTICQSMEVESDNLCPINRTIKERLKCLEKNAKFQKLDITDVPIEGLKSIRQRCKELEILTKKETSHKETSSIFCDKDQLINSSKADADVPETPKFKGWVKHVVNKLQNDN
ncbi:uncharacterized protein LOC111632408 isoform X1 [Centruroides sculpturatus]|uniref:uncharacterized protein LOC111632408 isoform X1 n=2 Tax=Centruroides sculpturatus TaxID=218467 RepID=UPI000C6EAB1E|nr:uncharacterized protein LOC111632408 isoform X1 [Centruroides sculpturatus]